MNRCLITYDQLESGYFSEKGLNRLHPGLSVLYPLEETAKALRIRASTASIEVCIPGSQPKLGATLDVESGRFRIPGPHPCWILKTPHTLFPYLPENEDLSMRLARLAGIPVPVHGLIPNADGSLTYFIRRFDRIDADMRIATEDFAQLIGASRTSKRMGSMESLVQIVNQYCSEPELERKALFRRTIFNYLIGNQDMHLKNFSLISRQGYITLSPAYDLVNSTILLNRDADEIGLSLKGVRKNLDAELLIRYYGQDVCSLRPEQTDLILHEFSQISKTLFSMIAVSFLPLEYKALYSFLLEQRMKKLNLTR